MGNEEEYFDINGNLADFLIDSGYKEDESTSDYDRLFFIPNTKKRKQTAATHKIAFDFLTIKFIRGFWEHGFECQVVGKNQLQTIIDLQKNDKMQLLDEKGKIK